MQKKFSPSQLEKDFDVLFGPQSRITVPFWDGDLLSSALGLFFSALITSVFFALLGLKGIPFSVVLIIVPVVMFIYYNWQTILYALQRKKLWKEYGPIVANTTAYHLLEEAVAGSRRGVVAGLKDRKESDKYLLKLWKAAFAEEGRLRTVSLLGTAHEEVLDDRPVGDQIKDYFQEREEAVRELNR